jgi:phosphatidate cytidylyltransferase
MGTVLALLAAGALLLDGYLSPYFPCLLVLLLVLGLAAAAELRDLVADGPRPSLWLCLTATAVVLLANWPAHVGLYGDLSAEAAEARAWRDVLFALAAVLLLGFLVEMATYQEPGGVVTRLSLLAWMTAYLALLPSFLAQLRWWGPGTGVTALALTIFVPKVGDIGAFFTGRFLGRHKMTPRLSPKKTWEGLAGGLAAAALLAVLLNRLLTPVLTNDWRAAGFGLAVGLAGVLGDLAESLVKRDRGRKDASQALPGFGGVLDVVDSILFAAPVSYWLLRG